MAFNPLARQSKPETAFRANLEALKAVVQVHEIASDEVPLYQSGENLRGPCPLPDHEGDSPSFYCYPTQGFYDRWHCHRCSEGGDVLDLWGLMRLYGRERVGWCVEELADRFGVRLWRTEDFENDFERRARLAERDAQKRIERVFTERLFERSVMPLINSIPEKSERLDELNKALTACGLDRPVKGWA